MTTKCRPLKWIGVSSTLVLATAAFVPDMFEIPYPWRPWIFLIFIFWIFTFCTGMFNL